MEYLAKMGEIQNCILEFLDEKEQSSGDFESLLISKTSKLDKYELKSVLYLVSKITKSHHRSSFFFDKTKKIITILKDSIKETFSNSDLFHIFKSNKLVLLILFNEGILLMDENILNYIKNKKYYYEYFKPEIEGNKDIKDDENLRDFEEKRRQGENDSYLCNLIRNDNIVDFGVYYNKNMISLDMKIEPSIFETNSFLLKREPTLIEYSVFYGSTEIFNFLRMNKVEMDQSLLVYSIHGRNPEITHLLEENRIGDDDSIYEICLRESIKCHHNDFVLYYKNNFCKEVDTSKYLENDINYAFRFYNFEYIPKGLNEKLCFFYSVQYDYYKLVEYFRNIKGLNINEKVILYNYY